MKNSFKILIVALLIGFTTSCKSEKKDNVESEVKKKVSKIPVGKTKVDNENFKIKLDFTSNEGGLFQVLYNLEKESNQWERKYFKIKKSEELQTIDAKFDLNEFGSPKIVRLILGGETPKEMQIKDFVISADGNVLDINADNFDKFIAVNNFIKFNKENNTLTTFKVNDKHVPIMALTKRALDSLSY